MSPEDLNAMAARWEADLAKLPVGSFVRESLAKAIRDLRELIGDERSGDKLDNAKASTA